VVILRRKQVVSEDVCERAYEKGYIQGANAAYGKGYRDGKKEGFEKGCREGYKKGWGVGLKKGYETAREKILANP
jgi:flagellar biosynthesis/type III secretory pathway protein FliH